MRGDGEHATFPRYRQDEDQDSDGSLLLLLYLAVTESAHALGFKTISDEC